MKVLAVNCLLFVLLSIVFSGCSESASSSVASNTEAAAPANTAKKNSEYPPLPEKVAQADMQNLDRTTTKIADRKGKVVLLNLWATWCGYCKVEMPHLVRMQDEFRDKGFEIIGVNVDDEPIDKVNAFAEQMKLNYTLVWADEEMATDIMRVTGNGAIPQSLLIDRDGNFRGRFLGAGPAELKKMEKMVTKVIEEVN